MSWNKGAKRLGKWYCKLFQDLGTPKYKQRKVKDKTKVIPRKKKNDRDYK